MNPEPESWSWSPLRNETSPVAVPGVTLTWTFTGAPCVIVAGDRLIRVVVLGVKVAETQLFTRLVTFTDPSLSPNRIQLCSDTCR